MNVANQTRQPMPGGHHDCIPTPSARHGCAFRSPRMKLFVLALFFSVVSVLGAGCKPTPSVVELPRPNSGTFSEAEAEARKFEILSNAPSLRLENWKCRNMGFCIHIDTNDSVTVYGHPGKELPKLFPEYDKASVNPSPEEIQKMIDEIRFPGGPRCVLITSDKSLNNSKTIHELLKVLFRPSIQLFYVKGSEQGGAANRSQPVRAETNRTSSAAGSDR